MYVYGTGVSTSGAVTKGRFPLVITREIEPMLRRVEDADR